MSIFNKSNEEYNGRIENNENIPKFFEYIISSNIEEESKILVLKNFLKIIQKNRYLCEYFSKYENKSIYLYLFELYLNTDSQNLRIAIIKLIEELILSIETNKDVYEFIFQKISKIYDKENSTEEKSSENLHNYLILLDTLFSFKEKIPKPRNYFSLNGQIDSKFKVNLENKTLKMGYCTTFILNFKIPETNTIEETSNLINLKFVDNTSIEIQLKLPGFLLIKHQNGKVKTVKALPKNDYIVLVVNIIFNDKDNLFHIYIFINGENNLTSFNAKTNIDIKKDKIQSLSFFENFFGEVTSISMLIQNDNSKPIINSAEFLPIFKNFIEGFHKKKYLQKFIDIIKKEKDYNFINNFAFCFTPFNYFNNDNCIIEDVFGNYTLNIINKKNIRNHRYQYYQKKIYLVCDITNFLPIGELFLIHPFLLTETNLELYLNIIANIINMKKRNIEAVKESHFFDILFIFFEKYPYQIFTEKILNAFINIGKIMFKENSDLTETYFKHVLLNEKILSKYDKTLQMKFWTQILLFCESDREQLENKINMNRICLILRYYDKSKFKLICCQEHLNYFKNEFNVDCNIMQPSMNEKLADIWKIIDLIINSQEPKWVLSLFKLLLLDLSPCLINFITISVTKALIRHSKDNKKENNKLNELKDIVIITSTKSWLEEFINQLIDCKYESIIINAFIHSLPDVRINLLKLIYQLYLTLISFKKENYAKIFFEFMKNYLLPQQMFYEVINENKILVINETYMIAYLKNLISLLTFWSTGKKLIEVNNVIIFEEKEDKINPIIKYCDVLEILFELMKQINYNLDITTIILNKLQLFISKEINSYILLYNYKSLFLLLDIIYAIYSLYLKEKKEDLEILILKGIEIISDIYINSVKFKANSSFDTNYCFNEIELLFLWGNKIIFDGKNNSKKNSNEIKTTIFSFIYKILLKISNKYKAYKEIELKEIIDNDNYSLESIEQNYIILMYKLFEFSFEYVFDKNNIEAPPNQEIIFYNSIFLSSMRISDSKNRNLNSYWDDYQLFDEIYNQLSYMWSKKYIYKNFNINKLKTTNKIKKYENILEKYILNKDNSYIFLKSLKFLTSNFIKENNYNNYFEISDKNAFTDLSDFDNNTINISFLKIIQINLISILTIIASKQNEEEFIKWIKEFKHFIMFLIISSIRISIKEKNKDHLNIQQQILYTFYICLYFLYQLRIISKMCKEKINNICINTFLFCFIFMRYFTNNYKKGKNDYLKQNAIIILFNDYICSKELNLLNKEELNKILDENNYKENIKNLLDENKFKERIYLNENLKKILYEKYFPFVQYKKIIEKRLETIKRINIINNQKKYEFNINTILELLPSYEKELIYYSNNSLEQRMIRKNIYRRLKKNLFSWDGYWSNKSLFFENKSLNDNSDIKNNDSIANKNNISKIKYKIKNHYTKSFMKPILVPILDMSYYLPDFTHFDSNDLFNNSPNIITNMDLDTQIILNEDSLKRKETVIMTKDNYLKKIYEKSSQTLLQKLAQISDTLDLGKEDEFSILKDENNNNKNQNIYYCLCCLVKPSHHIKGVCYIEKQKLNFKIFLNQKTGNIISGTNLGFTDKDDDYDINRKTCFGSFFMFHKKDKNIYKISIKLDDIKFLVLKKYFYKNSAFEIFTKNNKSYFFNFKYEKERKTFIDLLIKSIPKTKKIINDIKESKDNLNIIGYSFGNYFFYKKAKLNSKEQENKNDILLSKIIKDWSKWRINNFSFLMHLNLFANRSYMDLSQYPIFPWILNKYSSPIKIEKDCYEASLYYEYNQKRKNDNINDDIDDFDISNNSMEIEDKYIKKQKIYENYNYRDMKLPMGMMELSLKGKKRKEEFIEKYNDMVENQEDHLDKPFYYGSNYSNAFFVCNFLMRLFPFTHISIELQGKLDDPNRLFLSVKNSFENSTELQGDVRELIPEFFYFPEMFLNINDINLGKIENGIPVYNVNTPCFNNAYAFSEIMNRILNGDCMSRIINEWINLIFGYQVLGKESENAKNIYSQKSYQENINLDLIEDKINFLSSAEYGLIPTQLLNKECQKRKKKKDIKKEKEISEFNSLYINKLKIIKIKNDTSLEKKMKNIFGDKKIIKENNKNEILHIEIFEENKLMILYDNNIVTKNEISSSSEDIINIYKLKRFENKISNIFLKHINNKTFKFCQEGKNLIVGGFYDGKIEIIYLDENIEIKKDIIYPFSEEEPILCIELINDEDYLFLGNTMGNIAIYKIDWEKESYILYKKIFNQKMSISDININLDLNILATSSIKGVINLYTWPLCKLFRVIKVQAYNNNYICSKIFLSESTLPSIIVIIEKEMNNEILSYSINGELLLALNESKNISNIIKFKNINSYEYLAYFINNELKILNLPSLSIHLKLNTQNNFCFKFIAINNELDTIYALNEDGTQIQVIRS